MVSTQSSSHNIVDYSYIKLHWVKKPAKNDAAILMDSFIAKNVLESEYEILQTPRWPEELGLY